MFNAAPITLREHPDWIAVVDARHGDTERAAKELAFALASADILAGVIFRNRQDWGDVYITRDENERCMQDVTRILAGKGLVKHIQPGHATPYLHVDTSPQRSPLSMPELLGGLTGTMSYSDGGTCIVKRPREQFMRDGDQWLFTGDNYEGRLEQVEDAWQAQDGDSFWVKARNWPETHLPGVHFSPPLSATSTRKRSIMRVFIDGYRHP